MSYNTLYGLAKAVLVRYVYGRLTASHAQRLLRYHNMRADLRGKSHIIDVHSPLGVLHVEV